MAIEAARHPTKGLMGTRKRSEADTIGDGVIINQGCNIGHDSIIGDYTTIMPGTGISGSVTIGSQVSIGGHAFIVPNRKIGNSAPFPIVGDGIFRCVF